MTTRSAPSRQADSSDLFAELRCRMIDRDLRARGVNDSRVLAAIASVPREEFVPDELRSVAYDDRALPIGLNQTISQPFTVAFMLESLGLRGSERVLEIGTGSGYGAAVLSRLSKLVHTVERIPELARLARDRLQRLGYDNVIVHVGDGSLGLPAQAPFDAIVVTASADELPPPLAEQLAIGGRLVMPIGEAASQTMCRFTRHPDGLSQDSLGCFAFVPLVGQYGRTESPSLSDIRSR